MSSSNVYPSETGPRGGSVNISTEDVKEAWAAIVGHDIANSCHTARIVPEDLRAALTSYAARHESHVAKLEAEKAEVRKLVNEQAEDDALWLLNPTITEDMLQRALRKLHAVIEGDELMLAAVGG